MAEHLQSGKQAEQLACNYLEKQGLKLVQRNFYCRRGEIDLIMQDGQTLVFIEVRYRR
ncbi:YraN family protein, partial [Methylophaga sp. UBA3191]